jgi:hypothetical protein
MYTVWNICKRGINRNDEMHREDESNMFSLKTMHLQNAECMKSRVAEWAKIIPYDFEKRF